MNKATAHRRIKLPYEFVERMKDKTIQRAVESGFLIADAACATRKS